MKSRTIQSFVVVLLLLFVVGCDAEQPEPTKAVPTEEPPATLTAEPAAQNLEEESADSGTDEQPLPELAGGILISEVLVGIPGNNNQEFIELYNAGAEPAVLDGHTLSYLLADGQDEQLVFQWQGSAGMAAHGHYLLARPDTELEILADAEFDVPLAIKGALILRDAQGEVIDQVGWGNAPGIIANPIEAPKDGAVLERLPGGEAGNGSDTGDPASDFQFVQAATPQNSGSPSTPAGASALALMLELPEEAAPGQPFEMAISISNEGDADEAQADVYLALPAGLELAATPEGARFQDGVLHWDVGALAAGETSRLPVSVQAPWTYFTARFGGQYAEGEDAGRFYGAPQLVEIGGGAIPIAAARDLVGETVVVEGVATMYTGGFFAGSSGVKFYLEDDTGGIQVYVDGGNGVIDVGVGDRVRVTGGVELYRDALELTPEPTPEDVVILEEGGAAISTDVPLAQARGDEQLLGSLVSVEGVLTSITENSFDYTMDLEDAQGNTLLLLLERDTGVDVEPLEVGENYQVTGLLEHYSGRWQLKPRMDADFERVFPPVLRLDQDVPNNVAAGDAMTVTMMVANHTSEPLTNVFVTTTVAGGDAVLLDALDGASQDGQTLIWSLDELAAEGGAATLRYMLQATGEDGGQIQIHDGWASADNWGEPAVAAGETVFVGAGVPIWAIQGGGDRSPYIRLDVTTDGIVTGIFPELGGFWMQEPATDEDPATSAGIFVLADATDDLASGDLVEVTGRVREMSGQTTLAVVGPEAIVLMSSDNPLPAAIELNPPLELADALPYYEALEGMLVQVSAGARVVQPTSQYGEYALVLPNAGVDRVYEGDPTGILIFVDDASPMTHEDASTLAYAVSSGDTVGDLLGPLAYTFDQFKIEPVLTPTIQANAAELPMLPSLAPGEFSIATYNVENFFDDKSPHPSSPEPPDADGYALKLAKIADAVAALGFPTIMAIQEVENMDILGDLAQQDLLAPYMYEPVLIEGFDSRGIDVGYLVRGDQATVVGASQHQGPNNLYSRPPLLMTVTLHLDDSDQTLYLLNNHFLSLSGGEEATEPQRTAQAAWNVSLVQEILERDPDALIAVLGDLNSFYDSLPIDTIRDAGLRHVYEFAEPERLYTYIYQGESETLDHILVTPALYDLLQEVTVLHINADYPPPDPADASARRGSDHDPLLIVFSPN